MSNEYEKLFGLTKPERTTQVSAQNAAIEAARPKNAPMRFAAKVRGYVMPDGGVLFRKGRIGRAELHDIRLTEQERNRLAKAI